MKRSIFVAMAFVGLLVGAGFATGAEVIQYFISFGWVGIVGAVIAGIIMGLAGAVILGLGSYFLADEHNYVFRNVSHPVMSRFLDVSVTFTLGAVGVVMLAGAGENLAQQFDIPSWIGSFVMTVIVIGVGLLNVDKVSNAIGMLTPLVIIAVIAAFIYTMFNLPDDFSTLQETARAEDSPIPFWLLSAVNYNGLALLLGVSMSLVIGGNHTDPRASFRGGIIGGVIYTVMLVMAAVVMFLNIEDVAGTEVPMLTLFDSMAPWAASLMVWVIFAMIFNTAIGMFYALGRRLSAGNHKQYPLFLIVSTLVGFGISFFGFDLLMDYLYPVIGFLGMVMVAVLCYWWIKHRSTIKEENVRRARIRDLTERREDDDQDFTDKHADELESLTSESNIDDDDLREAIDREVAGDDASSDDEDGDGEDSYSGSGDEDSSNDRGEKASSGTGGGDGVAGRS